MSYMYRLTPEILRFHPLPPFIFPYSPFKKWIQKFYDIDHKVTFIEKFQSKINNFQSKRMDNSFILDPKKV